MKDVDALIKKLGVTLLHLVANVLNAKAGHLQVLLVRLFEHLLKFDDLRDAALPGYDGPDRVLDR